MQPTKKTMNFVPKISKTFKSCYTWGDNNKALGKKFLKTKALGIPNKVPMLSSIRLSSCGGGHSMIITEGNKMYACGRNDFGQLGTGDKKDVEEFVEVKASKIEKNDEIISIACGDQHSAIVSLKGIVMLAGKGFCGQLGFGLDKGNKKRFTVHELLSVRNIARVACGMRHSVFLSKFGQCYTCGWGKFGQLGHGRNLDLASATVIEQLLFIDVKAKNCFNVAMSHLYEVYVWGGKIYQKNQKTKFVNNAPTKICHNLLGRRCLDIAASADHGMVLTSTGEVFTFGFNLGKTGYVAYLQQLIAHEEDSKIELSKTALELKKEKLDTGKKFVIETKYDNLKIYKNHYITPKHDIIKIQCGENSNFAISRDGSVYSWGRSDKLELGHGKVVESLKPKKIQFFEKKSLFVSDLVVGSWHVVACVGSKKTQKSTHLVLKDQKLPKKLVELNS